MSMQSHVVVDGRAWFDPDSAAVYLSETYLLLAHNALVLLVDIASMWKFSKPTYEFSQLSINYILWARRTFENAYHINTYKYTYVTQNLSICYWNTEQNSMNSRKSRVREILNYFYSTNSRNTEK